MLSALSSRCICRCCLIGSFCFCCSCNVGVVDFYVFGLVSCLFFLHFACCWFQLFVCCSDTHTQNTSAPETCTLAFAKVQDGTRIDCKANSRSGFDAADIQRATISHEISGAAHIITVRRVPLPTEAVPANHHSRRPTLSRC